MAIKAALEHIAQIKDASPEFTEVDEDSNEAWQEIERDLDLSVIRLSTA